jgi:hypothetical protein
VARNLLLFLTMKSFVTPISQTKATSTDTNPAERPTEVIQKPDQCRQLSPLLAHELNNMLTIIQGYAENLLIMHGKTPALEKHLEHIAEAARRATKVIREAVPKRAGTPQHS